MQNSRPTGLFEQVLRELRDVVTTAHPKSETVRTRVRLLSVVARQEQLPVEKVLVHLKTELAEQDLDGVVERGREPAESQIVAYLIDCYYSDAR